MNHQSSPAFQMSASRHLIKQGLIPAGMVIVLALIALLSAPAFAQQKKKGGGPRAMTVGVDKVIEEPLIQTVPVIGRFIARQSGQVASRVAAVVSEIRADVGDRVETGDVIVVLDKDVLKWKRELQRLELKRGQASIVTKKASVTLLEQELKRLNRLRKSPAFSQARYDDKAQEVTRSKSEAAEAEAALGSARARLKLAEIDFNSAEIKAPYSGVISQKLTEVGSYVKVGDPVVVIIDDGTLEIEADVPSSRIAALKINSEVSTRLSSNQKFTSIVRAIIPNENPRTRTRTVRFTPLYNDTIDNVAANQSLTIEVPAGPRRQVITVHKDAVLNRKGNKVVFIAEGNKAQLRPVDLGEAVGSRFVVNSGLKAGDMIVVRGNERLAPNSTIKYKGMPKPTAAPGAVDKKKQNVSG